MATGEVDLTVHPSGIVPQLQNVVATVNLGCKLDLKEIALHARNAEYNPKRFAAVIMRIRDPKTTALIFASGKMVCTGAKSEEDARTAARKYAKIIQKLGFPAVFKEFKIQNIVGSCDVKFPIRLEGMSFSHHAFANYEPELFPGLIYRHQVPKVVLLIFVSGKVVLTGAKRREDIYTAFENVYPILQSFRKGAPGPGGAAPALPGPQQGAGEADGAGPSGMQVDGPGYEHPGQASPGRIPPPTPHHHTHGNLLPAPTDQHQLPPATPMHESML